MPHWEYTSGTLPWTKSCFVCGEINPHGLRLRSRVEQDRIVTDYTTREEDLGYRHIVHGGISMTLLDEVMTWAAILTLRRASVAAELTVRLKQPVMAGQSIRVEGWIREAKSKLVTVEGQVLDRQRQVLATASGKYVPMPAAGVPLCLKDFVDSPDSIRLPFLEG
ncbi:MAG: PaaI family thioesterase [bacterium]